MKHTNSRHMVDPELLPLLDLFPARSLSVENLPEVRLAMSSPVPPVGAMIAPVVVSVRNVPGPSGAPEVSIRVYRPSGVGGKTGGILHIHGGGYIGGAAVRAEALHCQLAADLGCVIVSVDYRLAPETRFPGAVEDCYASLAWFIAEAPSLGVDRQRIGVMGESAGAGLAASLALMARDRGEYQIAFQHLIYPMLDDRTCVATNPNPTTGEFIWTRQNNYFGWSSLLGATPGSPGISPYAAAARATDVSNLPPTFIAVGALDLFLDEDLDYARRLMRAGVPVELHVYPGAFHGFQIVANSLVAQAAQRDSVRALTRHLARS